MKIVFLLVVAGVLIVGGFFLLWPSNQIEPENPAPQGEEPVRYMDIETYVRTNISTLSPEKEVLGGTFYVTEIETGGGLGVVSYEDGHNAFTADFTYEVSAEGKPTIVSFTIRN